MFLRPFYFGNLYFRGMKFLLNVFFINRSSIFGVQYIKFLNQNQNTGVAVLSIRQMSFNRHKLVSLVQFPMIKSVEFGLLGVCRCCNNRRLTFSSTSCRLSPPRISTPPPPGDHYRNRTAQPPHSAGRLAVLH